MRKNMTTGQTVVFIDGTNLYASAKLLNFSVDYGRLQDWLFEQYDNVLRINYYTTLSENDGEYQTVRPLLDWLDYNGYNVITKKGKVYQDDDRQRTKTGIDIEMAVDIVLAAQYASNIIVISGDGNMKKPSQVAQGLGCHVTAISTRKTQPSSISDELRRQVDDFIDLADIAKQIEDIKRSSPRPALVGAAQT